MPGSADKAQGALFSCLATFGVIPGWVIWTSRPKALQRMQSMTTRAQPEQPVSNQPFPATKEDLRVNHISPVKPNCY